MRRRIRVLALSSAGPQKPRVSRRNGGMHRCSWLEWQVRRCWRLDQRREIRQSRRELIDPKLSLNLHVSWRSHSLLLEWRKPPIIWTCGGDRQRISSIEASWPAIFRAWNMDRMTLSLRKVVTSLYLANSRGCRVGVIAKFCGEILFGMFALWVSSTIMPSMSIEWMNIRIS